MKKTKRGIFALVMVLVLAFSSMTAFAAGPSGSMTAADFLATAEDGVITLEDDVTVTTAINVRDDLTIDLNGKTLTLAVGDNHFNGKTTITNGTINIDGTVSKGDCIIGIGHYSTAAMTFDGVTLEGDNYNSAYTVIYVYGESTFDVTDSVFDLSNDQSAAGGVIKGQSGTTNSKITIKNTEMNLVNPVRGFVDGTFVIEESDIVMTGEGTAETFDNGINGALDITIKNSSVDMSNGAGRGLTLAGGTATIINSEVSATDFGEASIRYKDTTSVLTVDDTSVLLVEDLVVDGVTEPKLDEYIDFAEGTEFITDDNGQTIIYVPVTLTMVGLLDGVAIDGATTTVDIPKGTQFTAAEIAEIETSIEYEEDGVVCKGLFLDKTGKNKLDETDVFSADTTLYMLFETVQADTSTPSGDATTPGGTTTPGDTTTPGNTTTPSDTTSPKTGDIPPVGLYVVAIAAVAAVVGGFRMRKVAR